MEARKFWRSDFASRSQWIEIPSTTILNSPRAGAVSMRTQEARRKRFLARDEAIKQMVDAILSCPLANPDRPAAQNGAAAGGSANEWEPIVEHRAWPIPVRGWRRSADQDGLAMTEK